MNVPLDVADLPHLNDDDFVQVDDTYLEMASIPYRMSQVGVALATILSGLLLSLWLIVGGVAVLAVLELGPLLRRLAFPHLGFIVREHDFSVRHGLLTRTVTTIPYRRIQNSVVNQGPLERHYGLATLTISSARGTIQLPGLPVEDANKIRAFVAQRAMTDSERASDGA